MDPDPRTQHKDATPTQNKENALDPISRDLPARVLVLHTGGSMWVDAIGMRGPRTDPMLRWLPGSGRTELGHAPAALATLGDFCADKASHLSHFVVALSEGEVPVGPSAQLAVVLAATWYWRASRRGLTVHRPHVPAVPARRILAATGSVSQEPASDRLFAYVIDRVRDIEAKVAALAERLPETNDIDFLVPEAQIDEAAEAITTAFPMAAAGGEPRTWALPRGQLRVHPVRSVADVDEVVDVVLAEVLGGLKAAAGTLREGYRLEDRFVLRERMGEGGAATVWRAGDERSEDDVAVKILHPHLARSNERLAQFYRGARIMGRLGPGVASIVHSPGVDGAHRYFAMEYLSGGTLRQAVLAGRLDPGVEPLLPLVEALARAHGSEILHRDIKPENILLDADGNLILVDFGLADASPARTTTRALGSMAYCAPEVLVEGDSGPRSDVYSLAMTLAFALHGDELPVEALREPRDFLEQVSAPDAIKWSLAAALDIEPSGRPADGQAFLASLERALSQGEAPEYVGPASGLRREIERAGTWRLAAAAALVGVAALSTVGLFLGWQAVGEAQLESERALARAHQERRMELAWRIAPRRPAEAFALLHGAEHVDIRAKAILVESGGSARVRRMQSKVLALAASSDGTTLFVGQLDGVVVALDVATGTERWRQATALERVNRLIVLPDTEHLAAFAHDASHRGILESPLVFLELDSGAVADPLSIAASPSQSHFGTESATTVHQGRMLHWDLASKQPIHEELNPPATGLYAAPDGYTGLVTERDRSRLVGPDGTRHIGPHLAPIMLAWSGDSTRFALGDKARVVAYDTSTLSALGEVAVPCRRRLYVDETGRRGLCGGEGVEASLVHFDRSTAVPLAGPRSRLALGLFVDDLLVTGSFDGEISLWDGESGTRVGRLAGHTDAITSLIDLGGGRLATGSHDKTVRIWDYKVAAPVNEVLARGVTGRVAMHDEHIAWRDGDHVLHIDDKALIPVSTPQELTWSPDGQWLLSAGRDGNGLWHSDGTFWPLVGDVHRGAPRSGDVPWVGVTDITYRPRFGPPDEIKQTVFRASYAPIRELAFLDEDRFLIVPFGGNVTVLHADGSPLSRLDGLQGGLSDFVMAPDGRLALSTWDAGAGLWDPDTGRRVVAFLDHTEEIVTIDLTPDGTLAATGSWDATARIWSTADGEAVHVLRPDAGIVSSVQFSPDGEHLAVLTGDTRVGIYDVATGEFVTLQASSRARQMGWFDEGLLTVELDGTIRRRPNPIRQAVSQQGTNLRVCPGTTEVVAVTPWPDPAALEAPEESCESVRAAGERGTK